MAKMDELRVLVDLRAVVQKSRIAMTNRQSAIERGVDISDEVNMKLYTRWGDRFERLEEEVNEDVRNMTEDIPVIQEMVKIKGIGPMLAAKMVSMIDITKDDTPSALWRYAGFAVIDGKGERPKKGEKLHYNRRLKTTCFLVAKSFLTSKSPYREIYDNAREYYLTAHPDWTKMHQHRASLRKMIKVFLCHLWEVWRAMEGLSTQSPWIIGKDGHTHQYDRKAFGWEL